MKRLIAKRRLKHGCGQCKNSILKGNIYYKERVVFVEKSGVFGYTNTYCPKCKYRNEQHNLRYESFKDKCTHPEAFIEEIWTYIPGEAVKEPSHCVCRLCGSIL